MEFDIFLTLSHRKTKVTIKAFELPYHPNVFAREDECQKHTTVCRRVYNFPLVVQKKYHLKLKIGCQWPDVG